MSEAPPLIGQGVPCPRCLREAFKGGMRLEAVLPLPPAAPPRSETGGPCCHDCAAADTLVRLGYVPNWSMARTVVANGRQEQLRLPGAPMGLVYQGLQRPCVDGDLDRHHAWLQANGLVEP